MKNFIRSVPGKILCFALCIVLVAAIVGCVVGAVLLLRLGVYTNSRAFLVQETQYQLVRSALNNIIYQAKIPGRLAVLYAPEATNLSFLLTDKDGNTLATNLEAPPAPDDDIWCYRFSTENDPLYDDTYLFYGYLDEDLPVQDAYAFYSNAIRFGYAMRYWVYVIGIACLLLWITCYVCLLCGAGRRPRSDGFHPGFLHKVPFDLLLVLCAAGCSGLLCFADRFYLLSNVEEVIYGCIAILLGLCAFLALSMSFAARIKDKSLLKSTLVWRVCRLLWKLLKLSGKALLQLLRNIPLIWRTVLVTLALFATDFLLIIWAFDGVDGAVFLWLFKMLLQTGALLYAALFMRKLQQGGAALAAGDLTFKTDTRLMFWDFKRHGENLNRISEGMSAAVEERLRSERMKTELITNVSHDIKTPLTSIINYATLIAEVPCDCAQHAEYSQVLVRKSEHLRRLLDDLVEVSKASTGNLEVVLTPCDANVLLTQAAGEFAQRCENAGLTLITSQPEAPLQILADSRRIWRVFENLMSNACKYSLSGSRVFLSLEQTGSSAVFTFRNTSNAVLSTSADELMERFVRGDSSRSTEGSGLGLSIAQSLTQLQGGTMDVTIDGDLFKVTLRFPLI